jgi:hypothetical protein
VDQAGRRAAGLARSAEAVADLLALLSTPPGAPPVIGWTGAPLDVWTPRELPHEQCGPLMPMRAFLDASANRRAEISAMLRSARARWDVTDFHERIAARADELNRSDPLIPARELVPREYTWPGESAGYIDTNEWIDPATVVGGNARCWNDFAKHRPDIVGRIIHKLLTANDPGTAAFEVLSDDSIVYLERADGPAGPIHVVTTNGTHRTHALRILGVPMLAAQVAHQPVPLRVHERTMRLAGPVEPLWQGLRRRGLLAGDIVHTGDGLVLEPYLVAAPWLLCPPDAAASITAAYNRVYPGAFDVPPDALRSGVAWYRWLRS